MDSACGYAALSLVRRARRGADSWELKANLLAPDGGGELRARGRVLPAGRTLTVCQGDCITTAPDGERHVATALVNHHPRDRSKAK